jgi:hypothetical protein
MTAAQDGPSRLRIGLALVAAGLVVGLLVAVVATITGASLCSAAQSGTSCYQLTRTLSIRTGLVAGAMTVVILLLFAGLLRMVARDEEDRAERAMEDYLADRERAARAPRPAEK